MSRRFRWSGLAAALLLAGSWAASACSACYGGKTDSPLAQGMNWGIMSLLGIIVTVLVGVAAFFIFLARKSSALEPEAPTAEPAISSSHV